LKFVFFSSVLILLFPYDEECGSYAPLGKKETLE